MSGTRKDEMKSGNGKKASKGKGVGKLSRMQGGADMSDDVGSTAKAAPAKKVEKVKGPKPDYTRKKKPVVQMNTVRHVETREQKEIAQILWTGCTFGLVEADGVVFNVREIKIADERKIVTIYVDSAPQESGLMKAELLDVYLTCGQLHSKDFVSKLTGEKNTVQQALWAFLRKVIDTSGLLVVAKPKPAIAGNGKPQHKKHHAKPQESKFITSPLKDMGDGRSGFYDLGGMIVKQYQDGKVFIMVADIKPDHNLAKLGIKKQFAIPTKYLDLPLATLESIDGIGDAGKVFAFTSYINEHLEKWGIQKPVVAEKPVTQKVMPVKKQGATHAPQLKKTGPTLATSDGKNVEVKKNEPKTLGPTFFDRPYGLFKLSGGAVMTAFPIHGTNLVKIHSAPEGHPFHGVSSKVSVKSLREPEVGFPGKELREYFREQLRKAGALPEEEGASDTRELAMA